MIPVRVRVLDAYNEVEVVHGLAGVRGPTFDGCLTVAIPLVEVPPGVLYGTRRSVGSRHDQTWVAIPTSRVVDVVPRSMEVVQERAAAAAKPPTYTPLAVNYPSHAGEHLIEVLAWDGEGTGQIPETGEWRIALVDDDVNRHAVQFGGFPSIVGDGLRDLLGSVRTRDNAVLAHRRAVVVAAIERLIAESEAAGLGDGSAPRWVPLLAEGVQIGWSSTYRVDADMVRFAGLSGPLIPIEVVGAGASWSYVLPAEAVDRLMVPADPTSYVSAEAAARAALDVLEDRLYAQRLTFCCGRPIDVTVLFGSVDLEPWSWSGIGHDLPEALRALLLRRGVEPSRVDDLVTEAWGQLECELHYSGAEPGDANTTIPIDDGAALVAQWGPT